MKYTYIATLGLLVLTSVFLANYLPISEKDSSVLQHQAQPFASLLPTAVVPPSGALAEPSSSCAQNVSNTVLPAPATPVLPRRVVPVNEPPPPQPPESPPPTQTAAPVTVFYYYPMVPLRTVPTTTIVYPIGYTPSAPVAIVPVMPVVRPAVPVYVPQVVASRVGPSKLVYSNGVVIKPKVYFPHQPVRNSIKGVTP